MAKQEQVNPEYDLLGLALSTEFSECSIAAAELNAQVGHRLEMDSRFSVEDARRLSYGSQNLRLQKLCVVGASLDGNQEYLTSDVRPVTVDGISQTALNIVLAQPMKSETVSHDEKKGWFRHVARVETTIAKSSEPLLAIVLNEETILPIASFARREDGICSYVQLGSEINDDNLFVVSSDEATSRHGAIEAIRTLLRGDGHSEIQLKEVEKKAFDQLVISEFAQKSKEILAAKEAYLARQAYRYLDDSVRVSRHRDTLSKANDEAEVVSESVEEVTVFGGHQLEDGRVVKITLVRPADNPDQVKLYAVSRGSMALPLVLFDKNMGTLDFPGLRSDVSFDSRMQLVSLLSNRFNFEAMDLCAAPDELQYNGDELGGSMKLYATILAQSGLLNVSFSRYNNRSKDNEIPDPKADPGYNPYLRPNPNASALIERFLDNTGLVSSKDSPFVLAKYRLDHPSDMQLQIFNLLNIQGRSSDLIGETSGEEERLLSHLAYLSEQGTDFKGTINNVQIGKTTGSALINARIEKLGTLYHVTISAKPQQISGEEPRPVLDLKFDASKTLFDRTLDNQAVRKAKDRLIEINRILFSLVPTR